MLLGHDKCLQVLERRGNEVALPNLSVPDGGPILDYLQRGKYSLAKVEIVGTSGSYSTIGPLDVIILCGLGDK